MDDQAFDQAVRRFAFEHAVDYTEAARRVAALADVESAASPSARLYGEGSTVAFREATELDFGAAQRLEGQWIEVFKAGQHTDISGSVIGFSQADVDTMARQYSPQRWRAPLVIGHPYNNAPAYGWVAEVKARPDGVLLVRAEAVQEAFATAVRDGRYKKRSVSLFAPGNPRNPTPGAWYLQHVGFLGAFQPAVKDLRDLVF